MNMHGMFIISFAIMIIIYGSRRYKIEIAGGLGPTVGKVFRIGVLGYNATPANVRLFEKKLFYRN